MKAAIHELVIGLPLLWSRIYTLGLPGQVRADRLGKIASDVHEQRVAADPGGPALSSVLESVVCVAAGVGPDLLWRLERGHQVRVAAIQQGTPQFPVLVMAFFAMAGIAGAVRLSVVPHMPAGELTASILALLAGPLLAVLGVITARQSPAIGLVALVAGSVALMVAADSLVAPLAAALGLGVGLFSIVETRMAEHRLRTSEDTGAPADSLLAPPPVTPGKASPRHATWVDRWLFVGSLGAVIGVATGALYGFSFPYDGTDDEIRAWYAGDRREIIYGVFLGGIASGVGIFIFFGGLFWSIRLSAGMVSPLPTLMLAAAAAAIPLHMASAALRGVVGMTYEYNREFAAGGIDPQLVRVIDSLVFAVQSTSSVLMSVSVVLLAYMALHSRSICPSWLGWLTAGVGVLLFLDSPLFGVPYTVFVAWMVLFASVRLLSTSVSRIEATGRDDGPDGAIPVSR